MSSLTTLILNTGTTHRCDRGHPWIYSSEIARSEGTPATGDEVIVQDARGRFVGRGFYSASSKIAVRLLTRDNVVLDRAFIKNKIELALAYRESLMAGNTCRRLISSEGDQLPGLIVDRYEHVVAVQCTTAGMDQRLPLITELLSELCNPGVIVERNDVSARRFEGLPERSGVIKGTAPGIVRAHMGSAHFPIDVLDPHKTGAYLDQQLNWGRIAARVKPGMRVLDACCHLGGFGIHALRAGAEHVLAIDSASEAITGAQQAAEWTGRGSHFEARCGNIFDILPELEQKHTQFDVIILDPPSFTRSKDTVEGAMRGYKELHIRALRMLAPGGMLATFTCSHHVDAKIFLDNILAAANDTRRTLRLEERLAASPDHPTLPAIPESEYLKGFLMSVLAP